MTKKNAILVSLPWADFSSPVYSLSHLSAYAKREGFTVDMAHAHLEIAAMFGFEEYEKFSSTYQGIVFGELLSLSFLFPAKRSKTLRRLKCRFNNILQSEKKLLKAFLEIFNKISWKNYQVFGLTINHGQLFSSLLFAKWAKEKNPKIIIVAGGAPFFAEMARSILMNFKQIDYIVKGEGEIAFIELLRQICRGKIVKRDIPGVYFKDEKGIANNPETFLDDLSGLPEPDYKGYFDLLNSHSALSKIAVSACLPVEVARGCKHRCSFCCYHDFAKNVRIRPPKEIADSISRLNSQFRPSSFFLLAPEISAGQADSFFDHLISHKCDYKIFCEVRASVKKELLNKMKSAGVCEVQIGIESFSSKVLHKMNKGTRFIDNLQAMKNCEELGIYNSGNLIINYPNTLQTDIDISTEQIDYACAYRPQEYSKFRLFHGSIASRYPSKYGITRICNSNIIEPFLPKELPVKLALPYLDFRTNNKKPSYWSFKKRISVWKKSYNFSLQMEHPLLTYFDLKNHLRIVDCRFGNRSIVLEGIERDVYLFCDTKQSWNSIMNKFGRQHSVHLKDMLLSLCRLKLMFTEHDEFLSLAIRSSNANRRNLRSYGL